MARIAVIIPWSSTTAVGPVSVPPPVPATAPTATVAKGTDAGETFFLSEALESQTSLYDNNISDDNVDCHRYKDNPIKTELQFGKYGTPG